MVSLKQRDLIMTQSIALLAQVVLTGTQGMRLYQRDLSMTQLTLQLVQIALAGMRHTMIRLIQVLSRLELVYFH